MFELSSALASGDLYLLIVTAAALGLLHTIMGPDHYLPFVMMARAQDWSRKKTAWITFACGFGHVASSIAIGALLAWGGMAVSEWAGSQWLFVQELRGSISAWLLIGVGAAFAIWGIMSALRGKKHSHSHVHANNLTHAHEHDHNDEHMHVHASKAKSITPWILFTIFIFGPCESLIPLILASWSTAGLGGVTLVSIAFSITTIGTIMGIVGLMLMGINRIPLGGLERWSTALAGISLIACGGAIQWLGL